MINASIVDVTVIIPTYNRAKLLPEAIGSCLSQTAAGLSVEILVVDDGSTDSTAEIMKPYGDAIRYVPQPINQGRNRARNIGLQLARGSYIKFLDSDDILEPGALQREFEAAVSMDADIAISGWQTTEIWPSLPDVITGCFAAPDLEPVVDQILAGKGVPTSAALYAHRLISELEWDEALRKLDDWDWFIRAAFNATRIVSVPVISYSWRQHPCQGIRAETLLKHAHEHYVILRKLEHLLRDKGLFTQCRAHRLAQYHYKELRVLCLYDRPAFELELSNIYRLSPDFLPVDEERQWWMAFACRAIGTRRALLTHTAIKRLLQRTDARK